VARPAVLSREGAARAGCERETRHEQGRTENGRQTITIGQSRAGRGRAAALRNHNAK